jgi:hypothetical protein
MKKNRVNSLVFALLVLTGLAACKKDSEPTVTDLLTQGPWLTTSLTVEPTALVNGRFTNDVHRSLAPCDQDDRFELTADGKYFFTEGPTKCQMQRPDLIEEGTWVLKDDQVMTLSIARDNFPVDWNIVSVTAERLQVTYAVPRAGTIYVYNRTLTRAAGR